MTYRDLLRSGLSEILLAILFIMFTLLGVKKPSLLVYLAVGFALVALSLALYSLWLRKQQVSLQKQQMSLQKGLGERFPKGERGALGRIRSDIDGMIAGDHIAICGTGATSIVHIANNIYEALRRRVNIGIYVVHPNGLLLDDLAKMEPDFEKEVFDPFVETLKTDHDLRKLLGAEWANEVLRVLTHDKEVCVQEPSSHICSLHGRVIWASSEIWKRIAALVVLNDPGIDSGQLKLSSYRRIPFIKAWRFSKASGDKWYYATDYLYFPGVGIDNPIRRVERTSQYHELYAVTPGFINLERIDAHVEFIDGDGDLEVWELKPRTDELPEEPQEERHPSRKPDKPSPSRSPRTASDTTAKSRKASS